MELLHLSSKQQHFLAENDSGPAGLSLSAVKKRIFEHGPNTVNVTEEKPLLIRFGSKFKSPLIILLLFASFISALVGSLVTFLMIMTMVAISVSLDMFLEHQSEKAAESLKQKVEIKTTVIREGAHQEVSVDALAVGDLVLLTTGSIIPADIKIVAAKDLHIDESTLTGESFPTEKQDFESVYQGTMVVNGEALGVVTVVGASTRFGKIAVSLSQGRLDTDFEKGTRAFGYLVLNSAIVLVVCVFLINIARARPLLDAFLFALALAIGLTPELLPMIMTVNLAHGALRMAKKGVIVKHLPAIHNLGSMNVLCTDKTGTLTENRIKLERYENVDQETDQKVLQYAYLNCAFQSNLRGPLEEAVLRHHEVGEGGWQKIDEIPFDFVRKRLSVIIRDSADTRMICKGATEEMWDVMSSYQDGRAIKPLRQVTKTKIMKRLQALSQDGYRVLAVAYRDVPQRETKPIYSKHDEHSLTLLGLTAFLDPPKHDAKEALSSLRKEGVELKILTGDNEFITEKICFDLDLPVMGIHLGSDLVKLSEHQLQAMVQKTTIFAKLTPDQKRMIIGALQRNGSVVGYLGDGVNDANSLRQSDVGISVSNASDVARESADLILVTKSLSILLEGVRDGRKIFVNTMKYIFMNFGSNFGNMISVSLASFFLPFIPMLPIQIILNNLLYDFSQLALTTDSVDARDIVRPLHWDIQQIRRFILVFGPLSSFFDIFTFIVLLLAFHASTQVFRSGWFVESLVTQGMVILVLRTKIVPFLKSHPSRPMILAALGLLVAAIVLVLGPLASLFDFAPLPPAFWAFLIIILLINTLFNEIAKKWFWAREAKRA